MASNKSNKSNSNSQERHLYSAPDVTYIAHVNRWAIIIGISKYEHELLNLKYAHRDAESLYELLLKPSGGGFDPNNIIKLINEDATTPNITKALRTFLKRPAREDIVLIYLACHAAPDLERPNIVYLITHDTDPGDISGTALPMREIDLSLKENLLAERVVIIADTCHSAAIGGGRRSSISTAQAVNAYLQHLSETKGGVALLTSAEASETAQESNQWGGGHGVFTHFLLEGMRGEADGYGQPKDGKVTVRELFEYVRDNVKRATGDKQHPTIGTNSFDPNLPMAITGGIKAQEYFDLGTRLCDLAWRVCDPRRFRAAAKQFAEAHQLARLSSEVFPDAELEWGKALEAAGDYEEAIKILGGMTARGKDSSPSEAWFYLGLARAKCRRYQTAITEFENFLNCSPEDERAAWVKEYINWLSDNTVRRRYALLVGINKYMEMPPLSGCVNDVLMMKSILMRRYQFEEADIVVLLDEEATRKAILDSLDDLRQKANEADNVIIHYSGHSIPESDPHTFGVEAGESIYLIAHDTVTKSGHLTNGLSPEELHELINVIPAEQKTLILDTHPNAQFNNMARQQANYTLLLASDSAELAYESRFEFEGKQITAGLFTGSLAKRLEEADPQTLTYGQLMDSVLQEIESYNFDQTPLLVGDRGQVVFSREDAHMNMFDFSRRRSYLTFTGEVLERLYRQACKRVAAVMPLAHYSFGRAFLEKGNAESAIAAFQTALQQSNNSHTDARLGLGQARFMTHSYPEALTEFKQYASFAPPPLAPAASSLVEKAERLVSGRRHALLIGINKYSNPEIRPVRGAVNDARGLKEVLTRKFGFRLEDITMLLDQEATEAAIMLAFRQLVQEAGEGPALFFFAGNGSVSEAGEPTLVSADGRQDGVYDISVPELAKIAGRIPNLITILDAGWTLHTKDKAHLRTIPSDTRERPAARQVLTLPPIRRIINSDQLLIGRVTIYNANAISYTHSEPSPLESGTEVLVVLKPQKIPFSGFLTRALTRALDDEDIDDSRLTLRKWIEIAEEHALTADMLLTLGGSQDVRVFDNHLARAEVLSSLARIEQEPIEQTITLLLRLIEQRQQQNDPYPEGHLNLGIAYAVKGERRKSLVALQSAIALYTDQSKMAIERQRDPYAEDHYREARFQLGRVLFEIGEDFTSAVSELNKAISLDPANVGAYYYLGQAIRQMVERETLNRAKEALQTYLARGAPLGHEDEVRTFLESRDKIRKQSAETDQSEIHLQV